MLLKGNLSFLSCPRFYHNIILANKHQKSARTNSLSPNNDENEISRYIITACSNIQVMMIKKVITKDKMS